MREGLYKVEFGSPLGTDRGVIYAKGGKMWGGDSSFFYLGSYTEEGESVKGTIEVDAHAPGATNVFGGTKSTINFKGSVNGHRIKATATSPEAPFATLQANLSFLHD